MLPHCHAICGATVLVSSFCGCTCSPVLKGHTGAMLVLSLLLVNVAVLSPGPYAQPRPPPWSVSSFLLRQLEAESLLGALQTGAWHVSWKLQVFGREAGGGFGGQGWWTGNGRGWGLLYGLNLGHWASGQREALIQSLVQPHSCEPPRPPATALPPVHPLFSWSQAPQTSGQGWLGFLLPSPVTGTERLREGQGRDRQRVVGARPGDRESPLAQGGRQRLSTGTNVPVQRKAETGEGSVEEGGGGRRPRGIPTPCSPGGVNKSN